MQPTILSSRRLSGLQFRLRSLLLIVTWLACVLAVARTLPAAGIVAAVLSIPALVRTWKYVLQSERTGYPISTGELADTFVFSLVILLALGATWLLVAACAAGVAALGILAEISRVCGIAASAMARPRDHARALLSCVANVIGRQAAWLRGVIQHRRAGPISWIASAVILPGIAVGACIVASLLGVFLTAWAVCHLGRTLAGLCGGIHWLERELLSGLHHLLHGKSRLVRGFRSPGAMAYAAPGDRS
jgi:hypothetical protein